jgi:hypothetical protein
MVARGEREGRGLFEDLGNSPPVLKFSQDGGSLSICSLQIGSCDKPAFRFYLTVLPPHGTPHEFKFVDSSSPEYDAVSTVNVY